MHKICVSGYSDDVVEVTIVNESNGKTILDDEYGSYDMDTLFLFDDGTELRMHYDGAWKAIVEKTGTAVHTVEQLIERDDYYSDLFTVYAKRILRKWEEAANAE